VNDHIGAVVYNRELKTVIGMNMGLTGFLRLVADGKQIRKAINDTSDYSYQDCKYLQGRRCSVGNARQCQWGFGRCRFARFSN
jgi:hypothetical protein